jgi:hypothetical protein
LSKGASLSLHDPTLLRPRNELAGDPVLEDALGRYVLVVELRVTRIPMPELRIAFDKFGNEQVNAVALIVPSPAPKIPGRAPNSMQPPTRIAGAPACGVGECERLLFMCPNDRPL